MTAHAPRGSASVPSAADDAPRWQIEGPDFCFNRPRNNRSRKESIEPASRPEQRHAVLPQTLFQPGPKDDPADLFDARFDPCRFCRAHRPDAEASVQVPVRNEPPVEPPQAALRVVTGTVVRPLSRPVSNDPRGTIRDLSEEELIALFG